MSQHPRPPARHLAAVAVCLSLLAAVVGVQAPAGATAAAPAATAAPSAAAQASAVTDLGRRADLRLELVSRAYRDGGWDVVVDARLDSNAVCVPLVFDCIVGAIDVPADTQLVETQCLSPFWNHLILFRDHCLKQAFLAGYDQQFRLTFRTTQQSGDLVLAAEFGRGVLPWIFQRLARAEMTVDLDVGLTVTKDCPEPVVSSGASFSCTITVDYPVPPGATPPSITAATLLDTPDATLFPGGTGFSTSDADWSCPPGSPTTTCTLTGSVDPGETTTFTWAGQAAVSADGGTGDNTVDLTWTAPLSGSASAVDPITVQGADDTVLTISKVAASASVTAGQTGRWTITVTNTGPFPATDVTVADVAALVVGGTGTNVAGVGLAYSSGVGTWTCSEYYCDTASMPVGSTTFTATTPVPALATSALIANEAGVSWANNVLGPDDAQWSGATMGAEVASATTVPTTTPSSTPMRLAFAG